MSHQRFPDAVSGVLTLGASKPVTLIYGDNDLNARLYLQLHNASSATVGAGDGEIDNDSLIEAFAMPADDGRFLDFSAIRFTDGFWSRFTLGVAFVWSSTRDTVTAHGTATDCTTSFWYGIGRQ